MATMQAPARRAARNRRAAARAKGHTGTGAHAAHPYSAGAALDSEGLHSHLCAARQQAHAAAPRRNKRREARNKGWE